MKIAIATLAVFASIGWGLYLYANAFDPADVNRDRKIDIIDWSIVDAKVFPPQ